MMFRKVNGRIFLTFFIRFVFATTTMKTKTNDEKDVDLFVDKANWVDPNDMVNFGQNVRKAPENIRNGAPGDKVWPKK